MFPRIPVETTYCKKKELLEEGNMLQGVDDKGKWSAYNIDKRASSHARCEAPFH